jgi:hypothetical protein
MLDPSLLLGSEGQSSAAADRAELLTRVEREMNLALPFLEHPRFTHPSTPHAQRVRRERLLEAASKSIEAAIRAIGAARGPAPLRAVAPVRASGRADGQASGQAAGQASPSPRPVVWAVQEALRCVEVLYEREANLLEHSRQREDGVAAGAGDRLVVFASGGLSEDGEDSDVEGETHVYEAPVGTGGEAATGSAAATDSAAAEDPNAIYRALDPSSSRTH